MTGFLGEPTSPLTKPEKPDFFLRMLPILGSPILGSLASSENLLGPETGCSTTLVSVGFSLGVGWSMVVNAFGWGADEVITNVSVLALTKGGG